jgi:hypothetical protein
MHINVQSQKSLTPAEVEHIVTELTKKGVIMINQPKVSYIYQVDSNHFDIGATSLTSRSLNSNVILFPPVILNF